MEKRNVIEDRRTPEMDKQADADKHEKQAASLFKDADTKESTPVNIQAEKTCKTSDADIAQRSDDGI